MLFLSFSIYGKSEVAIDTLKNSNSEIVKRHFSANFKQKYNTDSFVYEQKNVGKNAWDRFKEWLYNHLKELFNFGDKSKTLNYIDLFLKFLAALLVLFVIYMIAKAILNKEGNWIFGKNSQSKITDYTSIEKNIHLVDFKKLISKAIQEDNKRLAIRYYYLWLLKKMNESQHIEWHPEKTSTEYSYEIKNQEIKNKFNYLSYLYNNIWYGEFEVTEAIFNKTKDSFDQTIHAI